MNKNMTFNVTLMDNRYGDNIRSEQITWQKLTKRIQDPPVYRKKGKDAIIGGRCEWEDCIATRDVEVKKPMFDGHGDPVLNEWKKQKYEYVTEKEIMRKRNGEPIKRHTKGSRKVIDRQLLFLDCDSIENPEKWLDNLYTLFEWWGWAFAIYSTFSATEKTPKYRVVIPLSKPVNADDYKRIVRAIMHDLDETNFDPCSDRATQLMFLPVWPKTQDTKTGEWENGYYENIIEDDGEPLDVDSYLSYLDTFADDYKDFKEVKRSMAGEPIDRIINRNKTKNEDFTIYPEGDPRNKNNIVGAFCREYSISEAIEEFELPYDYINENTYKYHGSTHKPGAFIKNDDTLFYSYHGTDPACGSDKNAWDLVMIHKFDGNFLKMLSYARDTLKIEDPNYHLYKPWAFSESDGSTDD